MNAYYLSEHFICTVYDKAVQSNTHYLNVGEIFGWKYDDDKMVINCKYWHGMKYMIQTAKRISNKW